MPKKIVQPIKQLLGVWHKGQYEAEWAKIYLSPRREPFFEKFNSINFLGPEEMIL